MIVVKRIPFQFNIDLWNQNLLNNDEVRHLRIFLFAISIINCILLMRRHLLSDNLILLRSCSRNMNATFCFQVKV